MRLTTLLLALCLAAPALRAAPQSAPPESSAIANDIAESCKADRARFCAGVKPGGGRIKACYEAHQDQLSKACQAARAAARAAEKQAK